MYVCMYVCVYVCMYVCMYMCVCVFVYTYIYIYRFIFNSAALYIYRIVCMGNEDGSWQSNGGEKQRQCAGYVTDMGTWRDIVG
jgi:hypothetical protein